MAVVQTPNAVLVLALGFWAGSLLLDNNASAVLYIGFLTALGYWAVSEYLTGVNRFRKYLGAFSIAYVVYRVGLIVLG